MLPSALSFWYCLRLQRAGNLTCIGNQLAQATFTFELSMYFLSPIKCSAVLWQSGLPLFCGLNKGKAPPVNCFKLSEWQEELEHHAWVQSAAMPNNELIAHPILAVLSAYFSKYSFLKRTDKFSETTQVSQLLLLSYLSDFSDLQSTS